MPPQDLTGQRFPDFSDDGSVAVDKVNYSPWNRLFPLITAEQLRRQFLFGLPLVSFFPDPVTGQRPVMTDDDLTQIIVRMVARVEELSGCLIMPSYTKESYPFDLAEYRQWGFMKMNVRPISALVNVSVRASDHTRLFVVPNEWVGLANLVKGQLSVMPFGTAQGGYAVSSATGQPPFLVHLSQLGWVPQFWQVECVAGFKDGLLPAFVNDLIGVTAAMEVLSMLGATYGWMTGGSLGIDGLSQSSSGPGPNLFAGRLGQLQEVQKALLKKFKKFCGLALVSGNV